MDKEQLLEELTKLAKGNNDIGKFGDGYEKAINEAIGLVNNLPISDVVKPKGTVCKHKGCQHRYVNEFDGFCLKHYTQKTN